MKKKYLILTVFFSFIVSLTGQSAYEIEGKVICKESNEPMIYAHIFNKNIGKGTITNADGYFRIGVNKISDTIIVSYIGYKNLIIDLENGKNLYFIYIEKNDFLLNEIVVRPEDNSFLYKLLEECKNNEKGEKISGKTYYELKTFVEDNQVELVEAYYNLKINGNQPEELDLKSGRVALRPYQNRFFASLEGSFAILMLNLYEDNNNFPANPLEFSKHGIKKHYYLELINKFVDDSKDSIFVIGFSPKSEDSIYFEGRIWVNKTRKFILKINLKCENSQKYPFMPLFSTDSISKVGFDININYKEFENDILFNHINYEYKIDYISRKGKKEEYKYTVRTKAVLFLYDYENSFIQPFLKFSNNYIDDYRKINAMPYNDFFWKYNDEFRLNDSINSNEQFFSDSKSLTNNKLFKSNSFFKKGIFEHPFIAWSKDGVKFKEVLNDTFQKTQNQTFISSQYNLEVKIFLDINTYRDSTDIITATIFDPYESYYRLPMNDMTHCFINMYFDLCEIQRRKLCEIIKSENNVPERIEMIYSNFMIGFDIEMKKFLNDVKRGTDEKAMKKYSSFILENLGIDNLKILHKK